MIDNSIADMDYEHLDREIKRTMRRSASDAVLLGYLLRRMMDERLWTGHYSSLDGYLREELHMDYTMACRFEAINRKYSIGGHSKDIEGKYEGYSQGVLIEMLNMPPELEGKVAPDMTVRQVREMKRQARQEKEEAAVARSIPAPAGQEAEQQPTGASAPDERAVQYLDDFAAYFVSLFFEWFQSDPRSRAMDLGLIPGEIRSFLEPYQRDWRFNSGDEEAGIRISDDHVRLCDGEGAFLGGYDWIHLASAINRAYLALKDGKDVQEAQGFQDAKGQESEEGSMQDGIPDAEYRELEPAGGVATSQLPELVKPDRRQGQYLDDFARVLITSEHDWMLADYRNRVLDVMKSPEEIRRHLGEDGRSWCFPSGEDRAAHIDLFDGYVQLWDGKGDHMGDFEWFYLAASIQRMWNVAALEMANRTAAGGKADAGGMEGRAPKDGAGSRAGGAPGAERDEGIADGLAEVRRILAKEQKMLDDCMEAGAEDESVLESQMFKRQSIIVAALTAMVHGMEEAEAGQEPEEREQPPLPPLRNNGQRREWLKSYRDWGLWYRDGNIGVDYYRYDFGNGARLVAEVYQEEATRYHEAYESCFLHLVGGPEPQVDQHGASRWQRHGRYSRYPNSETELVEFLKELQKKG